MESTKKVKKEVSSKEYIFNTHSFKLEDEISKDTFSAIRSDGIPCEIVLVDDEISKIKYS